MSGIARMSDNYAKFIIKLDKKFSPFIDELERISGSYQLDENGMIDFDSLSSVEQKTLHLSWLMAQLYYHVLSTPIMNSEGEVSPDAQKVLQASIDNLNQIKKDTFKMSGEDAYVADIIWKSEANKALIINLFAVALFLTLGVLMINISILKSVILIICGAMAFPVFFVYRNLPSSKLYMFRIIRLVLAVVIAIIAGMVL